MKKLFLPITLTLAAAATTYGIPAKPGFITAHQPDGSEIQIRRIGDERAHLTLSADGHPLLWNESRGFEYARILDDGRLESTGVTVSPTRAAAVGMAPSAEDIQKALGLRRDNSRKTRRPATAMTRAGNDRNVGMFSTAKFPLKGEQKALVILVEFQDVTFGDKCGSAYKYPKIKDGYTAHDYFTEMLNSDSFTALGATGSCRRWFLDNSRDAQGNSQFSPSFDLYGPVKVSRKMSYYGGNDYYGDDLRPEEMVIEACKALDDVIDFRDYDRNNDGVVDNIYIFYAGYGEADSDLANTIWPHSYSLEEANKSLVLDGVSISTYGCSNEVDYYTKAPDGIGTFTHEFSHVMGLPDLYSTSDSSSLTPGEYSVMDYGPYNNNGRTPPNYSAYERYALGWCTPLPLPNADVSDMSPTPETNVAYIVATDKDNEFFICENRQKSSWDRYIPGHGLLIWHVDYNRQVFDYNIVNNDPYHQYVDIVEAVSNASDKNTSSWTYPGAMNVTSCSFTGWSNKATGASLSGITESGDGKISFTAVNPKAETGVTLLPADDTPTLYYNMQGLPIASPQKGRAYIRVSGSKAEKIIF